MIRQIHIELGLLYLAYVLFFFAIWGGRIYYATDYTANFLTVGSLMVYVLIRDKLDYKINLGFAIVCLITLILFVLAPIGNLHINAVAVYSKIILLVVFFYRSRITLQQFIRFVNYTYLLYFIASTLIWMDLIAPVSHKISYFDLEAYGLKFRTIYGIEGSTSNIDGYSALVFILNLFLNKGFPRYFFAALGLFAVLASTRLTPIVGVVISTLSYFIIVRRWMPVPFILIPLFTFGIIVFVLNTQPNLHLTVGGLKVPFHYLMAQATHIRSYIWSSQLLTAYHDYGILEVG